MFAPTFVVAQIISLPERAGNERKFELSESQIQVLSDLLSDMVLVEGGIFYMGTDASDVGDNTPIHQVIIDDFLLSRYEVTQEQWNMVVGVNPSEFIGDNMPVENVSWEDCQLFIRKLNDLTGKKFRMPTEAEWEFAARGGVSNNRFQFAGSDYVNAVAWTSNNSNHKTHPVGMKRPNALGVYDMSGNVAEWCSDFYDFNYYLFADTKNPQGPEYGLNRVCRGGSWQMEAKYADVHFRNLFPPAEKDHGIGLRLAM